MRMSCFGSIPRVMSRLSYRVEWGGGLKSRPRFVDSRVRGNDVGVVGSGGLFGFVASSGGCGCAPALPVLLISLKPIPSFRAEWGGDPESMPRLVDSRVRGNDEGVGGFWWAFRFCGFVWGVWVRDSASRLAYLTETHPVIPGGVGRRSGVHAEVGGFPRSRE